VRRPRLQRSLLRRRLRHQHNRAAIAEEEKTSIAVEAEAPVHERSESDTVARIPPQYETTTEIATRTGIEIETEIGIDTTRAKTTIDTITAMNAIVSATEIETEIGIETDIEKATEAEPEMQMLEGTEDATYTSPSRLKHASCSRTCCGSSGTRWRLPMAQ